MNFNEKLINLRKTKGLSQEELGEELKVSRQDHFQVGVRSIVSGLSASGSSERLLWPYIG